MMILLVLVGATGTLVTRAASGQAAAATGRRAAPPVLASGSVSAGRPGLATRPPTVEAIDARLAAAGHRVPPGALVYAARIDRTPAGLTYRRFQAGGGALADGFWPASSIKVLVALGALDFVGTLGFTGDALVVTDLGGTARTLRSIYEGAVRDSSNEDYDLLVQIAGLDRLNREFLTPANGFAVTSVARAYAGADLRVSPPMILEQGDRRAFVPERVSVLEPECAAGNCSNLFEMTESVRRVVLNDEIPARERFGVNPSDIAALARALADADGFFDGAVATVLGPGARIFAKPGDAEDLDCLDVTLVESARGDRFLLSASVPHREGGCPVLAELAGHVLEAISR